MSRVNDVFKSLSRLADTISDDGPGDSAIQEVTIGCKTNDTLTFAMMCDALEQIGSELGEIKRELRRIRENERRRT